MLNWLFSVKLSLEFPDCTLAYFRHYAVPLPPPTHRHVPPPDPRPQGAGQLRLRHRGGVCDLPGDDGKVQQDGAEGQKKTDCIGAKFNVHDSIQNYNEYFITIIVQ